MAFKEVTGGNTIDIKQHKDKAFEGIYEGFKGITTKIGKQFIYKFRNPAEHKIFGIYGFTTLNMNMEGVIAGAYCRITYLGKKKMDTRYGKNQDVHICKVEVDDEYKEEIIDDIPEGTDPF